MILFTADWHIKLGQKNVPKEWALNRYRMLFKQIEQIDCDLHIIGGDLFDRIPNMEELQLFFEFVSHTKHKTIIYDGNHEATKKNHTFLTQLIEVTNKLNPNVSIKTNFWGNGQFEILPYADLHKKHSIEQMDSNLPLFTHVRGEIPPHVKPEVNLDRFNPFPIVFAGDLHAHSNTQRNIVYPGSPLTTSFHRSEVETGYILITDDWSWKWYKFNLPQLLRKTVNNPDEMVKTDFHHTVYELEGDLVDLSKVSNSELLDKKVVKRSTETALILDSDMNITEEVSEYLLYILELDDSKVEDLLKTFHDYT